MKKFLTGVVLGSLAGAVGYKVYKNNEDRIKEFLGAEEEELELEELHELRDLVDELIDEKESESNWDYYDEDYFDDYEDYEDEDYYFDKYDERIEIAKTEDDVVDDYILLNNNEENATEEK